MFARTVRMQLKPNSVAEFTQTIEKDIIPLLRKQPGFQDEIAFVVPDGTAAVSVSVWDHKEHAEAYHRSTYPTVLKALAKVVEGTPEVHTYRCRTRPSTRLSRVLLPKAKRFLMYGGGGHVCPLAWVLVPLDIDHAVCCCMTESRFFGLCSTIAMHDSTAL